MPLLTPDAKRLYFLTAADLHEVPRSTLYTGFGTGRAAYLYDEADLEAAALAKHGEAVLAKKRAARLKREANKRKRAEDDATTEDVFLRENPAAAARKEKEEEKAKATMERNLRVVGKPAWDLTITAPERVAGTKATLVIGDLPPDGWPGKSNIDCDDLDSPAYSYGNIHDFKGKSSEKDEEMIFVTKWKVCGIRNTGKLSVRVKLSDKKAKETDSGTGTDKGQSTSEKENEPSPSEEPLMVVGTFDSGLNEGVRRWSFKGYRAEK